MAEDTINVAVRVRPKLPKESSFSDHFIVSHGEISVAGSMQDTYAFDHIFDSSKKNLDVYQIIKPLVKSATEGINGCIFAYGQTSSGKTHSLMGNNDEIGIIPLAIKDIFSIINSDTSRKFFLKASYLEIYNERIQDLLNTKEETNLKIREDYNGNVFISCKEFITRTEKELYGILMRGNKYRQIEETKMNERSSRSHAIFKIVIESSEICETDDEVPGQVSSLHFIDLCGSERPTQTQAQGARLKEGGHINRSLSTLSLVIQQLSDNQEYINFRDSKLTRLLSNCLGGNSKTLILATITPAYLEDSISTLKFAKLAKKIKVKPKVNEILTSNVILKKYRKIESVLKTSQDKINELQEEKEKYLKKIQQLEESCGSILGQIFHDSNIALPPTANKHRRHTMGSEPSNNVFPTRNDSSNVKFLSSLHNVEETPAVKQELKILNYQLQREKQNNKELMQQIEELQTQVKNGRALYENFDLEVCTPDIKEDCKEVFSDIHKELGNLKDILELPKREILNQVPDNDLHETKTVLKDETKCNCDKDLNLSNPDSLLFDIHKKLCDELSSENQNSQDLNLIIEQIKIYLSDVEDKKITQAEELEETKALNLTLNEDVNWKNKKIQELRRSNHSLKEQCKALNLENESFCFQINQSLENSSILENTLPDDSEIVRDNALIKEIESNKIYIKELETKLQNTEDLKAYSTNYAALVDQFDDLKIKFVESQKTNELLNNEIASLKENSIILQDSLNNKDSVISLLENEVDISNNKLLKMSEGNLTFTKELEFKTVQLTNEKKSLENELKTIKNELETTNNQLLEDVLKKEELVKELQANIAENQDVHGNLKKVEDENIDLKEKLITSEKCINELKITNNKLLEEITIEEKLVKELQASIAKNQDVIDNNIKKVEDEYLDLNEKLSSNEKYINELETTNNKLSEDVTNMGKLVKELQENIAEYLDFEEKLNASEKYTNELMTTNNKLLEDIINKEKLVEELQANIARNQNIHDNLIKVEDKNLDLEEKLSTSEKYINKLKNTNNTLLEDVTNKDKLVKELQANIDRNQDTLKRVEDKNLDLEEKLSTSEKYINKLKDTNNTLLEDVTNKEKLVKELQVNIERNQDTLKRAEDDNLDLKEILISSEKYNDKLQTTNNKLVEDITNEKKLVKELQANIERNQDNFKRVEDKNLDLEEKLETSEKYANELQTTNNKLLEDIINKEKLVEELQANIARNQDLHDNLKEVEDKNLDLKEKLITSEKYINELETTNNKLLEDVTNKEKLFEELHAAIANNQDLKEKLITNEKCINELETINNKLLKDIAKSQDLYDNNLKRLEDENVDLKEKLSTSEKYINEFNSQEFTNSDKFSSLSKQVSTLKDEINKKNESLSTITKDLKCNLEINTALQNDIQDLKIENDKYKTSLNNLEIKREELIQEVINKDQFVENLNDSLKTVQSELNQLKIENEDLSHLRLELDNKIQENKKLNDQLKKAQHKLVDDVYKIRRLEEKVTILVKHSNDLDLTCYETEKAISEKDSIIAELSKKLSAGETYINELNSHSSKKDQHIVNLTANLKTLQSELNQIKIEHGDLQHVRIELVKKMNEIKDLNNKLKKAQDKLDESSYKIRSLEEIISILSNDSNLTCSEKDTDIKTELIKMKTINKENSEFLKQLCEKLLRSPTCIKQFKSNKELLESNIEALLKSADSHKEQIEKIKLEKTEIIQKMEQSFNPLKEMNSLLKLELENQTKKNSNLISNYEEFRSSALQEISQLKALNIKLSEESIQFEDKISKLEKIKAENSMLTQEILNNKNKTSKINSDYEQLKYREYVKDTELDIMNVKLNQLEMKHASKECKLEGQVNELKNEMQNWKETCAQTNKELLETKTKLEMLNFELERTKNNFKNVEKFKLHLKIKFDTLIKLVLENLEKMKSESTIQSTGQISCWEKTNKILHYELVGMRNCLKDGNLLKGIESMEHEAVKKAKSSAMQRIFELDLVIDNLRQSSTSNNIQCNKCLCVSKQINNLQSDIINLRSNLLDNNSGCNMFEPHSTSVLNLLRRLMEHVSTTRDMNVMDIVNEIFSLIKNVENANANLKSEDHNRTYILKVLHKLEETEIAIIAEQQTVAASINCNLCSKCQLIYNLISFMIRRLKRTSNFIRSINSENLSEDTIKMIEVSFYNDDLKIEEIVQQLGCSQNTKRNIDPKQLKEKYEFLKVLSNDRLMKVKQLTEENENLKKELSNKPQQVSDVQRLRERFNTESSREICLDPFQSAMAISNPENRLN